MLRIRHSVATLRTGQVRLARCTSICYPNTSSRTHVASPFPYRRQFSIWPYLSPSKDASITPPSSVPVNHPPSASSTPDVSASHTSPAGIPPEYDLEALLRTHASTAAPSLGHDVGSTVPLIEEILTPPIILLSHTFTTLHDVLHIGWPAAIFFNTIVFRIFIIDVLRYLGMRRAKRLRASFEPMRLALQGYNHYPGFSNVAKGSPLVVSNMALTLEERIANHYTPQTSTLPPWPARLLQLPLWLGMSEALRALLGCNPGLLGLLFGERAPIDPKLQGVETLASLYRPDIATEGSAWLFFWLKDLTIPDSSGGLPLMFGVTLGYGFWKAFQSLKTLRLIDSSSFWFAQAFGGAACALGLGVLATNLTLHVPSGLVLYWATSSALGLYMMSQNALGSPFLRLLVYIDTLRGKTGFVPPSRTLILSKKQSMFLADDILLRSKKDAKGPEISQSPKKVM